MSRKALRDVAGKVRQRIKAGCRASGSLRGSASVRCSARRRTLLAVRVKRACVAGAFEAGRHLQRISCRRWRSRTLTETRSCMLVSPSGPQPAVPWPPSIAETQALHAQLADAQATIRQQSRRADRAAPAACRPRLNSEPAHDAAASAEGHSKLQAELTTRMSPLPHKQAPSPTWTDSSSECMSASAIPAPTMPARSESAISQAGTGLPEPRLAGRVRWPAADHQSREADDQRTVRYIHARFVAPSGSAPQACAGAHALFAASSQSRHRRASATHRLCSASCVATTDGTGCTSR